MVIGDIIGDDSVIGDDGNNHNGDVIGTDLQIKDYID